LVRDEEKSLQAGKVLQKMRGQSEEETAATIAAEWGLSYVDLNIFPVSADDMRTISEEDSRQYKMTVFQKMGKEYRIGIVDPGSQETISFIEKLKNENGWVIHLYVISNSSLDKILEKICRYSFFGKSWNHANNSQWKRFGRI
jgi:hypothetical protein